MWKKKLKDWIEWEDLIYIKHKDQINSIKKIKGRQEKAKKFKKRKIKCVLLNFTC